MNPHPETNPETPAQQVARFIKEAKRYVALARAGVQAHGHAVTKEVSREDLDAIVSDCEGLLRKVFDSRDEDGARYVRLANQYLHDAGAFLAVNGSDHVKAFNSTDVWDIHQHLASISTAALDR